MDNYATGGMVEPSVMRGLRSTRYVIDDRIIDMDINPQMQKEIYDAIARAIEDAISPPPPQPQSPAFTAAALNELVERLAEINDRRKTD